MKPIHLIAAITFSMSGHAFAAGGHDHGHEHQPLHGGVVSEVKDMDYELVAKPESIQLHLRDHGKPVDVANVQRQIDHPGRHRETGNRVETGRPMAGGKGQFHHGPSSP